MKRRYAALVVVFCLCVSAEAALFSRRWWKPIAPGETLVEMPVDIEVAGEVLDVGPGLAVVRDELLGCDVIEHSGRAAGWLRTRKPVRGPFEIVALVRIIEQKARGHGATLYCGVGGHSARPEFEYGLSASSTPTSGRFSLTLVPRHGYADYSQKEQGQGVKTAWPRSVTLSPRFRDVSPVWEEQYRLEIESSLAGIPLLHETWFRLRIVRQQGGVQLYKDGLLIAERRPAGLIDGDAQLVLSGNVRVASFTVRRPAELPERFRPVPIEGVANAKGIDSKGDFSVQAAALPPADVPVRIGDVPFVLPDRRLANDHIDVGASLFHGRNRWGGQFASKTWPAPHILDPARILLSAPNRPYQRLWVIAASDEDDLSVPIVTARFYRVAAGFSVDGVGEVPLITATSAPKGVRRLPVTLADGRKGSVWLVPIELDATAIASRFREDGQLAFELTKAVHDYRAYPDPYLYDRFQGGLPSAVRIFGLTLEEAPIRVISSGNRTGNVYVAPEEPIWQVQIDNLLAQRHTMRTRVKITDPYGEELAAIERAPVIDAGSSVTLDLPIRPRVYGMHSVETSVELAGGALSSSDKFVSTQKGTFVQLPRDTRRATAANSRWGLWWWRGGHLTNPNEEEDLYLLRAAGTRIARAREHKARRAWGVGSVPRWLWPTRGPAKWAYEDPYDPREYEKFSEEVGAAAAKILEDEPDVPGFCFFTETSISTPVTYGILPRYIGEPEHTLTEKEDKRLRAFMLTAKSAAEGIRKHAPGKKVILGWCEPTFTVPFMRAGYPRELVDAIGIDTPQFERLPEMPIRSIAPNRMWILQEEMRRFPQYKDLPIIHTESYFPASHRLALGHRGSANHYVRTAVLSLALGSTHLWHCFTLHDCAGYWGSVHYGCIGMIGRRPEHNPKPAFPAYATMTRLLDIVEFDGYVPTGSLCTYCVRFKAGRELIYCLWTIRGTRSASLKFAKPGNSVLIDENGNETALDATKGDPEVTVTPTPVWVKSDQPIEQVSLGEQTYADRPGEHTVLLDSLAKPWPHDPNEYERYARNHWDLPRFPGPMRSEATTSDLREAKVWEVALTEPEKERKFAAWYGVFIPKEPIAIPGKARSLGVWANGRANWGRIIYEIEDAKGEVWQNLGAKDQWNCDDIHSWSYFCYDGWRFLEFPLPNHQPGDDYREKDTVWWNYSAEGVVDLPVELTKIILEFRTHHVYVNDCLAIPDRSVQLADLRALYADPESMTNAPVEIQRRAAGLKLFAPTGGTALPNPIVRLREAGVGAPTTITKIAPPDQQYDGTRVNVTIAPVEGAKEYRVYVAAYENGSGAQALAKGAEPEMLVTRLRPEFPLYLFATYLDKDGKESKPSEVKRIFLKDDFPMK